MVKIVELVVSELILVNLVFAIRNKEMTSNVTQTLDHLLASNRYDKRLRPDFGGSPVTISVNFFIKSMGPVSDNDQSFGLDCYFRQHWYDFRLQYQKLPGLEEFSMSWLFLDRVWKPDTYFVNGKRSFLHRITVPNKFLRLRHDGFITYSMRLTIMASCPMYLRKFPLDTQRCPLILGSYGYTNKDLIYKWTDASPIGLQEGVEIAQFDLANISTEGEKTMMKGGLPYSTVQANFWLKRHTGYFMLQVYIPCGLIVVASWISFWIDPDAVPARVYVPCGLIVLSSWVSFWIDPDDVAARVALGVTTVLSLTTMGFGGRAQLPKVSYWTALDWFVIICFTSVFSVMIEYAIVNFIDKFTKDFKKIIQNRKKEEEDREKFGTKEQIKLDEKPKETTKMKRSASFSFFPTKPDAKQNETIVEIEPRKLPSLRKLSSTVLEYLKPPHLKTLSQSIPTLNIQHSEEEEEEKAIPPKIVITTEEMNREIEDDEIVVDVEDDIIVEESGEVEEDDKWPPEKKKLSFRFMKSVQRPRSFLKKFKFLPGSQEIINLMESPEPPSKFSKIDVQSRRNFPIAFVLSLLVYLFAFSYYLTDDLPQRDSDLILYNQ